MASEQMTEYERKRLENIKRNSEMMSSLKIHSHISDLSSSTKRIREEKSYKQNSEKKKPKTEGPIVIRRSLRSRGMPPDSSGLPQGFNELRTKPSKLNSMELTSSTERHSWPLEDLSVEQTYMAEGSHLALLEKLARITRKTKSDVKNGHLKNPKKSESVKLEEPIDPCLSKLESNNVARTVPDGHLNSPSKFGRVKLEEPIDPFSLKLEYDNVARLVPGRIFSVRFFPTTEMTMVVAGNKSGHLGFWDVKPLSGEEEDVIHLYQPHSAPISGISVHPFALSKVYSSCYDGILRMMDIEREKFELVCTSTYGSSFFSLAQQPNVVNSLYLGEGPGGLIMFDQRVGDISKTWPLHEGRINSIDFNPANTNIMTTSSTDGFACVWDLRNMNVKVNDKHPQHRALSSVKHSRAVHSSYFSPSGSCLATTSLDDNIGVLCGANFEDSFMIPHDNWTNRWISSFRGVWGWDDTHIYIGNMKRRVDVVSVTQKKMVRTLESPHMTAIPCRYDAHPCNVGMLAGATSGGQVYIWTVSS